MLSPRIRRLKLDHDQLVQKFAGWPLIQITGTAGMPPEVYRFVYNIKGLFVSPTGEIQERAQHHLEVNLSLGYPRRAPQCRMLTPVFRLAAKWAEQHARFFPVDQRDIAPPLEKAAAPAEAVSAPLAPDMEASIAGNGTSSAAPLQTPASPQNGDANASASPDPWAERITIE